MNSAQCRRVLVEFNDTHRDYASDATLHGLFESQAIRTPEAPAAVFENAQLTYRQLNDRANALADHLREQGVHSNMPVGVCLERSLHMPVALLGVLKAGGGYVALDPEYPSDRLRVVLAESRVPILITTRTLAESLPDHHAQIVRVDAGPIADRPLAAGNPSRPADPRDLAYVIYTSGSTGRPKGVMVSHRAAANRLFGMQDDYRLSPSDVVLQKTPYSFDVSVWEFFWTLMAGARMVIAKPHGQQDHDYLIDLIRRHQITTLHFVPPVLDVFLQHPESTNCTSLKRVFCGGESLSSTTQRRFFENLDSELHHLYGPTETAIDVTSWVCQRNNHLETVPIGRPVPNVRIYILDPHMEPVPPGTTGELYVGGVQVAIGYLNRPDLTAERFIPDLFSRVPGARLYRTGDLGRWRQDGNIDFLGRLDQQVKIRGVRIELEEIEGVLGQHPSIRQCAVAAEGDGADRQLVAYVTADTAPSAVDLRAHLARRLPESMVPGRFVALETMPFSLNGKIDRAALHTAQRREKDAERQLIAPRTDTEGQLAEIWQEVLGLPRIGIDEDFFKMGGHSLRATVAIARMWDRFGTAVTLQDFFDRPTIAQLAAILDRQSAVGVGQPRNRIRPVPRDGHLALSFAQERLWFLDQWDPGSATYNISWNVRLQGPLTVVTLERSLQEVVRRHEALRTTFAIVAGLPQAVVKGPASFRLAVNDLRGIPESRREPESRRLAAEETGRPFDLSRDLMLRAQLLQLADQDQVLILTMHHIAADGWSVGVFGRELKALYEAFARNEPSPLPELSIQYADYAVWQRAWLQGEALERQLAYWKQQLARAPAVLELPTDFPRPAVTSYRGAQREMVLDEKLTQALHALSRREGVTLFMTLLAAWQVLLSRYSGQDDISVGAPIAGRNRAELEGLIGFFVNTLVLRTDLSGNPTFRELLGRLRKVALDAYAHQDLPFEKLVEELKPERNLSHSPLFQVMFALQNAPASPQEFEGLTISPFPLDTTTAKFDLTLSLEETANSLKGTLEYNTDLFEATTITRMLGHFQVLLAAIVADPHQPICALPLLTDAERRQLLVEWNDVATDCPHDRCVHELFEEQAERTPDAVAVVFEDRQLTYRQLNVQANRLAHRLIKLGVGPEKLVGLCLERSLEMIVGILGVLKAGGAYVPLDPKYPAERLAWILADAAPTVVLTTSASRRNLPPDAKIVILDEPQVRAALDGAPAANPPDAERIVPLQPQHPAYVIYTSGSTGTPKGVVVTHGNVVRLFAATRHWFQFGSQDVWTLFHSFAFDFSVWELWGALLHGGRLVVVPWAVTRSPADFLRLLAAQRVTVLNQTPSAFYQLMQADREHSGIGNDLTLRYIVIGGEALDLSRLDDWYQRHADDRPLLVNMYGITETTVHVTYLALNRDLGRAARVSLIGRRLPDLRVYVLDKHRQPTPIGVPGELFVAGEGLARGYLNQPELTAEKFVADPFSGRPGNRIYRTGDLARWRLDGSLEFLGRIDRQVKLRGFRIELGEIEAALTGGPHVAQSVVLLREDMPGDKRLVAYAVPRAAQTKPLASELRCYLQQKLPEYMVPSAYVVLDALPLTPHGKVDRQALPAPDSSHRELAEDYVAPRTPLEELLADIWCDVLGVEQVGIHDNFFDRGGHSLLATRVVSQVLRAFHMELPLRTMFERPTIEGLALYLLEQQSQAASPQEIEKLLAELESIAEESAKRQLLTKKTGQDAC